MYFNNVFRKCSKNNEPLEYKKINEGVEIEDEFVDSLMRSKTAKIKSTENGYDLYYNY